MTLSSWIYTLVGFSLLSMLPSIFIEFCSSHDKTPEFERSLSAFHAEGWNRKGTCGEIRPIVLQPQKASRQTRKVSRL